MKKYIFSFVCLCCALLPALGGQAHEYPNHPELRKSDANIVGHILDKNTKEHLPYITVALKGTTIGTVTDATGHYFLKNLPEGNFVLEVSSVGYKTVRRNVTLKKGRTLEEDFEIEEDAVALDGVVVSANRNETTRRLAPTLVNVVDLMKLQPHTAHPHGLTDEDYDVIFTRDKPIIFAFHGYPSLVHELTYRRHNKNIHVLGYREEGTITTPFDMRVQNDIDRFHLVKDVLLRLPQLGNRGAYLYQKMSDKLVQHQQYINEYGEDMPEVREWKWK